MRARTLPPPPHARKIDARTMHGSSQENPMSHARLRIHVSPAFAGAVAARVGVQELDRRLGLSQASPPPRLMRANGSRISSYTQ